MSAVLKRQNDIHAIMRDWADWEREAKTAGYSGATTLWRAMLGEGGDGFKSTLPIGLSKLETYGALRRAIFAISALQLYEDTRKAIAPALVFYRGGPLPMVALGMTYEQINKQVRAGEDIIAKKMQLRA